MIETIGILGYGNMGEAVARGLRARHPRLKLAVLEKREEQLAAAGDLGAELFTPAQLEIFLRTSTTVVLSVKPQDLATLSAAEPKAFSNHFVISVLAGTTLNTLQEQLGTSAAARLMPSLAARIGRAVVGVALPERLTGEQRETALEVACAMGTPFEVPESLMSAVTGLSGSGLAYVFAFIHALALGGVRCGLPYQQAVEMARDVTSGAAELLADQTEHPISMLSRVISPAGTTIEGVSALEQHAFSAAVMEAVVAAADRARELEQ